MAQVLQQLLSCGWKPHYSLMVCRSKVVRMNECLFSFLMAKLHHSRELYCGKMTDNAIKASRPCFLCIKSFITGIKRYSEIRVRYIINNKLKICLLETMKLFEAFFWGSLSVFFLQNACLLTLIFCHIFLQKKCLKSSRFFTSVWKWNWRCPCPSAVGTDGIQQQISEKNEFEWRQWNGRYMMFLPGFCWLWNEPVRVSWTCNLRHSTSDDFGPRRAKDVS